MIIKREKSQFESYLEDTSNIKGEAEALFIPNDYKEVSDVLKQAGVSKTPVTISGSGTGTTGGRVPLKGSILSLEKLDKIIKIDPVKKEAAAQAGVTLESLEKELNKLNFTFRASPTEPLACLGGVISTCASGPKSFKYSSVRDYVKEIKVVLSDGKLLKIRRGEIQASGRIFDFKIRSKHFKFSLPAYTSPEIKSSAGYYVKDNMDLIDLFIGQEGTLGCIVEAVLEVQPLPLDYFDFLAFFIRDSDALDFVEEVKGLKHKGGFFPCALEFFDNNSLEFLRKEYTFLPRSHSAVFLEQEIELPEQQDKVLDYWCGLIEKHNSSIDKCWFAEDYNNRKKLYEFRHCLPQKINEFLKSYHQEKTATDIAVPDESFREMYGFYEETARKSGIDYVNFGHIGQNHLHFNFLPKTREESFKAKGYIMEFVEKAISLKGTISAEHGIGKIKRPYLEIMYGKKHLKEMAGIKKIFDKPCVLGLDNIFSKELLNRENAVESTKCS